MPRRRRSRRRDQWWKAREVGRAATLAVRFNFVDDDERELLADAYVAGRRHFVARFEARGNLALTEVFLIATFEVDDVELEARAAGVLAAHREREAEFRRNDPREVLRG